MLHAGPAHSCPSELHTQLIPWGVGGREGGEREEWGEGRMEGGKGRGEEGERGREKGEEGGRREREGGKEGESEGGG